MTIQAIYQIDVRLAGTLRSSDAGALRTGIETRSHGEHGEQEENSNRLVMTKMRIKKSSVIFLHHIFQSSSVVSVTPCCNSLLLCRTTTPERRGIAFPRRRSYCRRPRNRLQGPLTQIQDFVALPAFAKLRNRNGIAMGVQPRQSQNGREP